MSLIDVVKEYDLLKDDKKLFLNTLDKRLKELEKNKPEYQSIADKIVETLEQRANTSLSSYMASDSDEISKGDIVIGVGGYDSKEINGLKGKVVVARGSGSFGIEWEKDIGGHTCDGHAKHRRGWNVGRNYIKKIVEIKLSTDVKTRNDYQVFTNDLVEKVMEAGKRSSDSFKIGDEVKIRKDSEYFEEEGKYGVATIIEDNIGESNRFKLKFRNDHRDDYRTSDIEYVNPFKAKGMEEAKRLVEDVVSGVESEFGVKDYEWRREELIKRSIPRFRTYKYSDSQVIDFFKERLSDVSDVIRIIVG